MNASTHIVKADSPAMNNLEVAQKYAQRGWEVFPVHTVDEQGRCSCLKEKCSAGKHPRTQRGFHEATTDHQQIEAWWTKWPEANIGIQTGEGSGIVVLDIDADKGGEDSLALLEERYGKLPRTTTVRTGGGGRHFYFRHPGTQVRNSAGTRLGKGLDVRGERGYVVAPPSRHASGNSYQWEVSPDECPPAPLPEWLRGLMVAGNQVTGIKPTINGNGGDDRSPAPLSRLDGVRGPIHEGTRNNTLISIAGRLRAQGRDEEQIYQALVEENARCRPPVDDDEIRTTASSVARYPKGYASAPPPPIRLRKPWEIMEEEEETYSWVWEGYIRKGGLSLLSGAGKVAGKSTLVFALARALGDGSQFLGRSTAPTRVVLLSEEPTFTVQEKMAHFGLGSARHLDLATRNEVGGRPDLAAAVQQVVDWEEPGLLIVDTLLFWANLPDQEAENDSTAIRNALTPLHNAAAMGWAVLVLHHTNKGGQIRGSTAFTDMVDMTLMLEKEAKSAVRTLKVLGTRFRNSPGDIRLVERDDQLVLAESFETRQKRQSMSGEARRVLEVLQEHQGLTMGKVAERASVGHQRLSDKYLPELRSHGYRVALKTDGTSKRCYLDPLPSADSAVAAYPHVTISHVMEHGEEENI